MDRVCEMCGRRFRKPPNLTHLQWARTRFCGRRCAARWLSVRGRLRVEYGRARQGLARLGAAGLGMDANGVDRPATYQLIERGAKGQ